MKMLKTLMVGAVATLSATSAFAASDGTLGDTSTGTTLISMDIIEEVRITGMEDISMSRYVAGAGNLVQTDDVCVHYNNGTDVQLTFTSTVGGFNLDDGSANQVPYTVEYEVTPSAGFVAVTDATPQNFAGAADADETCGGADPGQYQITVTDTGNLGLPNGTYTDTLSIEVAPQP